MNDCTVIVRRAHAQQLAVPGFNIPYLPMMEPVVRALRDTKTFGLIMVARLEWVKFASGSLAAIRHEYHRVGDRSCTRLHLDHVPVVDEDQLVVDTEPIFTNAVRLGYDSVMIDASRLPFTENVAQTRRVVEMAHAHAIPVEAELGSVFGHETGPRKPYEELFATCEGFTVPSEARRFVSETGVDWLSVAVGSVHGSIADATRGEKKPAARIHLERLEALRDATGIPLVLHGGTGIDPACVRAAIRRGIAKINIATAIRQPYERHMNDSIPRAQDAVYAETVRLLTEELELAGTLPALCPALSPQEVSHD